MVTDTARYDECELTESDMDNRESPYESPLPYEKPSGPPIHQPSPELPPRPLPSSSPYPTSRVLLFACLPNTCAPPGEDATVWDTN